jgi:prostaglandin-E synthase
MSLHPTVLWAQRADVIYLTVEVADIKVSCYVSS